MSLQYARLWWSWITKAIFLSLGRLLSFHFYGESPNWWGNNTSHSRSMWRGCYLCIADGWANSALREFWLRGEQNVVNRMFLPLIETILPSFVLQLFHSNTDLEILSLIDAEKNGIFEKLVIDSDLHWGWASNLRASHVFQTYINLYRSWKPSP